MSFSSLFYTAFLTIFPLCFRTIFGLVLFSATRAKGDFVEYCCAALLSTAHVPPGAELMLVDGFLQGTG